MLQVSSHASALVSRGKDSVLFKVWSVLLEESGRSFAKPASRRSRLLKRLIAEPWDFDRCSNLSNIDDVCGGSLPTKSLHLT